MKVTARSPATAKVASKPGVVLVVVVDLVVLVGSVEGVVLVVVVDLVASGPVVVVVDLVTSGLGFVLVAVVVDLVTSSAELRASSIVAMRMATNIFFISNLLFACDRYKSRLLPLSIIHNVFRGKQYAILNSKL